MTPSVIRSLALCLMMLALCGCSKQVEYIGWSGPEKNLSGIETGLMFDNGKPVIQVVNKSDVTKTINISGESYEVNILSNGKVVTPTLGIMYSRPMEPVVDEFEALLPNKTYYIKLLMEVKDGSLYVGSSRYQLEEGRVYDISFAIKPFLLKMDENNYEAYAKRLGLVNYVTEKLNCGSASIRLK
jgi:hypothetical protein